MLNISKFPGMIQMYITSSKPCQRVLVLAICIFFIGCGLSTILNSMDYCLEKTIMRNSNNAFDPKFRKPVNTQLEIESEFSDHHCRNNTLTYNVTDLLPMKTIKEFNPTCDRIDLQMNHVPRLYKMTDKNEKNPMKVIYLHGGKRHWYTKAGQSYFLSENCPVNRCSITYDEKESRTADAVVFLNPFAMPYQPPWPRRSYDQIWAMSALEAPHNTKSAVKYQNFFNWTMTYRSDSTIVTPYFKFLYYKKPLPVSTIMTNFAEGKTKTVSWMVSNCRLVSSGRMNFARQLAKFIDVDIYGACGTKSCTKGESKKCMQMIKEDYKFYLAFENSKCLNYYTEKVSQNALRNNAIPIILGVSRIEMEAIAPPGSYIHVEDFDSPKKLAEFLHKIDQNDNLFNQYFSWKRYGRMINTKTWCRFCSMLHETELPIVTQYDIHQWWSGSCIGSRNW